MNTTRLLRAVWLAGFTLAGCGLGSRTVQETPAMKASTTYLFLLRKTPMFTGLDIAQLRWTIAHSQEWEAQPGAVIAACGPGGTSPMVPSADDDYWVLLDGGWQLEHAGRVYPAGHADAGKWFSVAQARGDCRLVTTGHSYVMRIARADMEGMVAKGFAFGEHLQVGRRHYEQVFGGAHQTILTHGASAAP